MDIIFDDEDYYGDLEGDLTDWCEWQGIPTSKVIVGVDENNIDGIDYFVIIVNEPLFGYLMWKEFDMTEKYGSEGWDIRNYIHLWNLWNYNQVVMLKTLLRHL